MTVDREELMRLAKAASLVGRGHFCAENLKFVSTSEYRAFEDAADPPTIQSLLGELKAAEDALSHHSQWRNTFERERADLRTRTATAEAALKAKDAELEHLRDAASRILHWADTHFNKATGKTEGMVVSAEAVRCLWDALASPPPAGRTGEV